MKLPNFDIVISICRGEPLLKRPREYWVTLGWHDYKNKYGLSINGYWICGRTFRRTTPAI